MIDYGPSNWYTVVCILIDYIILYGHLLDTCLLSYVVHLILINFLGLALVSYTSLRVHFFFIFLNQLMASSISWFVIALLLGDFLCLKRCTRNFVLHFRYPSFASRVVKGNCSVFVCAKLDNFSSFLQLAQVVWHTPATTEKSWQSSQFFQLSSVGAGGMTWCFCGWSVRSLHRPNTFF